MKSEAPASDDWKDETVASMAKAEPVREPKREILKVEKLLRLPNLAIPNYQRPYKWTSKNVEQLLADISVHQEKSAYRLGTAVMHEDRAKGSLNIVDGQQRTVTLLLMIEALHKNRVDDIQKSALKEQLKRLHEECFKPTFTSDISKRNAWLNFRTIEQAVSRPEFTEAQIDFLLNRCEFVCVTLSDVSEAFQFFDAHNARGRDLAPHDLLKAFHLREFADAEVSFQSKAVEDWENSTTEDLENLFADYLYRVRSWVRGRPARHFSKDDVGLFKGVNLKRGARLPLAQSLRISNAMVDDYNSHISRSVDGRLMDYPFQLDQPIVNGRRFFEWVRHYRLMGFHANSGTRRLLLRDHRPSPLARRILRVLDTYAGCHRTGDRYVRNLFNCLLLYYVDRFGAIELSKAIEKAFIWAYTLRLEQKAVHLASIDNHARAEPNVFAELRDATDPRQFLQIGLRVVSRIELKASNADAVQELFDEMKYLDGKPNG